MKTLNLLAFGTWVLLFFSTTAFAGFRQGDASKRWPNGTVPYIIDSDLSEGMRKLALEAMDQWESKTHNAVRFVERTNETDYLKVTPNRRSGRWQTDVPGKPNGVHTLLVGNPGPIIIGYNLDLANFCHELGHVLGLHHEFVRPDRDSYIKLSWHLSYEPGWRIAYNSPFVTDGDYDLASVMNYPPCLPGQCGSRVNYVAVDGSTIPSTFEISEGDAKVIEGWYGGTGTTDTLSGLAASNASAGVGCAAVHQDASLSEIGSWFAPWGLLLMLILRILFRRLERGFFCGMICLVAVSCLLTSGCSRKQIKLKTPTASTTDLAEDFEESQSETTNDGSVPVSDSVVPVESTVPLVEAGETVPAVEPYPLGYFVVGDGDIFYSNGTTYCALLSWEQYVYHSGRFEANGILPLEAPSTGYTGQCPYPQGVFRVLTSFFYSDGYAYCAFNHYPGGATVSVYPSIPWGNVYMGSCND